MATRTDKSLGLGAAAGKAVAPKGAPHSVTERVRRALLRRIPKKLWAKPGVRRWWVAGAAYVLTLTILLAGGMPELLELEVGQVAPVDIMAPRDVVDRFRTLPLQEEAARQAIRDAAQNPDNFDINPAVAVQREEWLQTLFDHLAALRAEWTPADGPDASPAAVEGPAPPIEGGVGEASSAEEELTVEVSSAVPESPGETEIRETENLSVSTANVEAARARLAEDVGVDLSAATVHRLLEVSDEEFGRIGSLARRQTVEMLLSRRIGEGDVAAAQGQVNAFLLERDIAPEQREALGEVIAAALVPNLILSAEKVEKARQDAMRSVQDIVVREGQVIVRRGDPVREEHMHLLRDLGLLEAGHYYGEWLGTALLVAAVFAFVALYARQFHPDLIREERLLSLFGLCIVLVTGLMRVASLVPWEGALFLVPVALASMLIALLLDSRLAFVMSIALTVIILPVSGGDPAPMLVALAGGFTGVLSVSKVSQRGDLTRAGFIIGGATTFVMLGLALIRLVPLSWEFAFLGIVNGLVAAIATIGLLPYVEGLFGITSTIKLLELSNPNQPLLRKLLMEAPGSYHHSMIVGNLSEAAADAIGADSLLVRVGSLYHDIGKTKRPYFFVENQFGAENPHDKISPSLSTLIIVSHVKDGVEMAREHNLPEILIDFIREHHGTALVKYFYQKATENAKGEPVDPKDFSYPGPKPQSRETAIVMLADAVEAAVRSLSRPSPGRIEGLVRKVVKERLAEGELDESDLTLRDLERISDAFVRVLTGIFHKRIEYPELAGMEGAKQTG